MHFDILIQGEVKGKGLAFRVMKSADQFTINGQVNYIDNDKLIIEAEGDNKQLKQFLDWCITLKQEKGIKEVIFTENSFKNYNQFEMSI